ncbi:MAG TPA: cupredoxin domain-containing protein [Candidatus Bathyarchaeia archaeon]|nr:cupredoxin domain-containing protein [Candidatus Bathyarchaeia archaeon]
MIGVTILALIVAAASMMQIFLIATSAQSPNTVSVSIDSGSGINMKLLGYTPANITVVIGVNNTVKWTNNDNMPHTVTAVDGSFDSGNLNRGKLFVYTFTKPGRFVYYCTYHPWMGGTVTVLPAFGSVQSTTVSSVQSTASSSLRSTTSSSLQSSSVSSLQTSTVSSLQSQGYGNFTVTITGYQIYGMMAFGIVILVTLMVVFSRTGRRNE